LKAIASVTETGCKREIAQKQTDRQTDRQTMNINNFLGEDK